MKRSSISLSSLIFPNLFLLACGSGGGSGQQIALSPCEVSRRYEGAVKNDPNHSSTDELVAAATVARHCSGLTKTDALDECAVSKRLQLIASNAWAACAPGADCQKKATALLEANEATRNYCWME